jgi:hypothetical protein
MSVPADPMKSKPELSVAEEAEVAKAGSIVPTLIIWLLGSASLVMMALASHKAIFLASAAVVSACSLVGVVMLRRRYLATAALGVGFLPGAIVAILRLVAR